MPTCCTTFGVMMIPWLPRRPLEEAAGGIARATDPTPRSFPVEGLMYIPNMELYVANDMGMDMGVDVSRRGLTVPPAFYLEKPRACTSS